MNKKICILFFLLAINWSCNERTQSIEGVYSSKDYSRLDLWYLGMIENTAVVGGTKLELFNDSTFQLITCSTFSEGHWSLDFDTLILAENQIRWRHDSIQQYGYKGKWPQQSYKRFLIKNNKLIKYYYGANEKVLDCLIKTNK